MTAITTTPLHLSRVRLKMLRGEALASIAPLVLPVNSDQRAGHAHRVLWLLFQDIPDAQRDFLWRDEGEGRFILLSRRPPSDPKGLFEIETKVFAPELDAGDRLAFVLRANPVIRIDQLETRTTAKGRVTPKRKKVDVVMHALKSVPATDWEERSGRAFKRDGIAAQATTVWLVAQGEAAGFKPFGAIATDGYTQVGIERRRGRPAGFSAIDIAGVIEVTDPTAFLDKVARGFGSAKAFGNGLMLIRRA
jgi:CRISPR system Cascade subunit CasE